MRLTALFFCLASLAACGGDGSSDDTSGQKDQKASKPELTISAPQEGATFTAGDNVHLKVTATVDGKGVEVTHADWSAGEWTRSGNDVDVTDLPVGALTLHVEALVDGATGTADVDITIEEPVDITPVGYHGSIQALMELHGDFDADATCNGNLTLTGYPEDKSIAGDGSCAIDSDYGSLGDAPFTIEGTAKDGNVSGDLIMDADGTEYRTPFTGTGSIGAAINVSYDKTHSADGNSLRIYGTWSATPD